jgi:hypothetical protein
VKKIFIGINHLYIISNSFKFFFNKFFKILKIQDDEIFGFGSNSFCECGLEDQKIKYIENKKSFKVTFFENSNLKIKKICCSNNFTTFLTGKK